MSRGDRDGRSNDTPAAMRGRPTTEVPRTEVGPGDTGEDVARTVEYLRRFGYFPNPSLAAVNVMFRPAVPFAPPQPDVYDEVLEKAVRRFQLQQGLEPTGRVDAETLALFDRPRCGFPDEPVEGSDALGQFVAQGSRWTTTTLSYRFVNSSPDLSTADQRAAVRGAFDRWSAVTPLSFVEVTNGGDMLVSWASRDHGDGNAFDGPGTVLAHCFYPPPGGGTNAGDCHFDEDETWSVNTPPSGIDLATVALHELGHGLGLAHSNVSSAVMYAYYGGPLRDLTQDDIDGIRSLYGARFRWGSRGGKVFQPAVASNADGRLEVFVRGDDGALWHIWQTAPSNGWSGWESLGGGITGPIATGRNADGRLEVFVKGLDGALWHTWQTTAGGAWSGWESLGGIVFDPVVAANADGRLEIFVRGADGALWHKWQTAPSNGWSGWESLGGGMGSRVGVGMNADGRLEVFVRGTDGGLWHLWQTAPNGTWSGWEPLGGVITSVPAVGRNADGRLEVFARGTDGALWHIWQTAPNGTWSGWGPLGGGISDPVVVANADGRLEVFVRGLDDGLWHIWQTAPNNGWSPWETLSGRMTEGPIAGRNADGRLEVFVKGTDAALWHTWQSTPNGVWN